VREAKSDVAMSEVSICDSFNLFKSMFLNLVGLQPQP
jgi:hypothetical protein